MTIFERLAACFTEDRGVPNALVLSFCQGGIHGHLTAAPRALKLCA
ncbi:hypothetical protein [Mesorhizobium sp.]|nr:hypothetical protein [Mesorhizobium sp.]